MLLCVCFQPSLARHYIPDIFRPEVRRLTDFRRGKTHTDKNQVNFKAIDFDCVRPIDTPLIILCSLETSKKSFKDLD